MSGAAEWYYSVDGNSVGPITIEDLRAKIATGEVSARDHVFQDGMDDWVQAQDINALWAQPETLPPELTQTPTARRPATVEVKGYNPQNRAQGLATASIVCAIVSIVMLGSCFVQIPGLVLGILALRELTDSAEDHRWRIAAWIGVLVNGLLTAIILIFFIFIIVAVTIGAAAG